MLRHAALNVTTVGVLGMGFASFSVAEVTNSDRASKVGLRPDIFREVPCISVVDQFGLEIFRHSDQRTFGGL